MSLVREKTAILEARWMRHAYHWIYDRAVY
jgi:hypothetical protein